MKIKRLSNDPKSDIWYNETKIHSRRDELASPKKFVKKIKMMVAVMVFSKFSCMFLNPNYFFNLNSNALDMRNFQNKVQKAFCFKSCTVVF